MKSTKSSNEKACSILIGKRELKYLLVRSNRKTIGISIEKDGEVKVTSPFGVSDSYIRQLLQKKAYWIFKKIEDVEAKKVMVAKNFEDGESFFYLGKMYRLKLIENNSIRKPTIELRDLNIIIMFPHTFETSKLKAALSLWYIEKFKCVLEEKVESYSKLIGVYPKKVFIKEQKTRWGSCSSKGNINLNWRLIMAPQGVIDYVIIHELCHMREMNHSKQFWSLVENILPEYKEYRGWLKHYGDTLSIG